MGSRLNLLMLQPRPSGLRCFRAAGFPRRMDATEQCLPPCNRIVIPTVVEGPAVSPLPTRNSHLSHPSRFVIPSEAEGSAARPAVLSHFPGKATRRNHPRCLIAPLHLDSA